MWNWILRSLSMGLAVLAAACAGGGSDEDAQPAPGAESGPGETAGGGQAAAAACSLAAPGVPISPGRGTTPSLVWTGEGYAVAWQDLERDGGDIRLAILDASGNKQAEGVVADGPETSTHPSVHLAGGELLVLWQDAGGVGSVVRSRRATRAGEVLGEAVDIAESAAVESWPVGAPMSSGSAVAWMDADQSLLGFVGQDSELRGTTGLEQGMFPSIAAEGGAAVVAWCAPGEIGFARAAPDGGRIAPLFHEGVTARVSRAALGKGNAFIAWEDTRNGDGAEQIYLLRISPDDTLSSEVLVPSEPGSANWPALTWTGSHIAVAYYQFRDGPPAVFLSLRTPELASAGGDLQVSGAAARFPSIAWTGQELGVAYAEREGSVYLARATCP